MSALRLKTLRRVNGGGARTADVTVVLVFNHPPLDARPAELEVMNNLTAPAVLIDRMKRLASADTW